MSEDNYKCACRGCHGGCMFILTVKDGKLIKAVPDPEGPLNRGKACIKGLSIIEQTYHPDRILYPMKRVGSKGSGRWKRITWEDALDEISSKFVSYREKYGSKCIATFSGTGRHHPPYLTRFAFTLGTTNVVSSGAMICLAHRTTAAKCSAGIFVGVDYYGNVKPGGIVVWGSSPDISGPDGELQWHIKDAIRDNIPLLVIDPYPSLLAQKANIWLRIRPGTDGALALGILNILIKEEKYDKEFVENWTYGFNELGKRCEEYPVEKVSEITGLTIEEIHKAADFVSDVKPLALEWGPAFEQSTNAFQTSRAILMLIAISGNWDVPGGMVESKNLAKPPYNYYDQLTKEQKENTLRTVNACELDPFHAQPYPVLEAMKTGNPYKVRAVLAMANNTLLSVPETEHTYECLRELEYFVYSDIFMNPTAELADIVLPAALWAEVNCVFSMPEFSDHTVLCQQKVISVGECRSDEEIIIEIAKRMGVNFGADSHMEIINEILSETGKEHPQFRNITFDDFRKKGYITPNRTYYNYKERGGFNTPTGKFELYSIQAEQNGADPLPFWKEPEETFVSNPKLAIEYPLIMINGKRQQEYFVSNNRQIKSLRKRAPFPLVSINPKTAAEYGINQGDWIFIETIRGRITQKAHIVEDLDEKVIHCQYGWWYPEDNSPLHGVFESNVNVLTKSSPPFGEFGSYQMRGIQCKIYKNDNCNIEERYYSWLNNTIEE